MPHFIVTLRLQDDARDATKHQVLVNHIDAISKAYVWSEARSFFSFQAETTAASLCEDLAASIQLNPETEFLVVIDLDHRITVTQGQLKYPALLTRGLGF